MFEIVPFILGAFLVMWLDVFWWKIDYKKAEKGLEWHEHYHVGLELITLGIFVGLINEFLASVLYGAGFLFLAAEWRQAIEVIGVDVKAGHPFAYGSSHFISSTLVGIGLTILVVVSYVYLVKVVESLL